MSKRVKEYNSPVAENMSAILEKKGLKQVYVAEKAGYTSQNISDMIYGRKLIKACDVKRLADAMGVTPNDLYAGEEGRREGRKFETDRFL